MMQVAGVSTLVAGLARCSDRSCPTRFLGDAEAEFTDEIHGVASMVTFVLWVAMPFAAAASVDLDRSARVQSLAMGVATGATFVRAGIAARADDPSNSGTAQRAMVATALAWFPIAARAAFAPQS